MATGDPPNFTDMSTTDQSIWVAQWDTSSGREYTYSDKEFREALDRIDRQQMDWDRVVMDGIAPIGPPPIASRMKVVKNQLDEIISEIEAVL